MRSALEIATAVLVGVALGVWLTDLVAAEAAPSMPLTVGLTGLASAFLLPVTRSLSRLLFPAGRCGPR